MGPRYLRDGENFDFSPDFGFTESSRGNVNARDHEGMTDDGNGTYVESLDDRALAKEKGMRKGGKVKGYAVGGNIVAPGTPSQAMPQPTGTMPQSPLSNATISMPVGDAARTIAGAAALGRQAGMRQTIGALGSRARAPGVLTANGAAPMAAPAQGAVPAMAKGGHLTTKERHALPAKDFALPGARYPIEDKAHARNALARVAQHGDSHEKAAVRQAVHRKYPAIGKK